jgi:AraC family transcriptional regulator
MKAVPESASGFAPLTLGTCLWSEPVGDLQVAETRAPPGLRLPWHAHEHACLVVLLEGSFTEAFRTRSVACDVATALFKPPGEQHTDRYGRTGARCLVVEFMPQQIEHVCQHASSLDRVANVRSATVMQLATRIHYELVREDALSPLVLEGVVLELLGTTLRHCGSDTISRAPRWLERTQERLHEEFSSKLSIAALAVDAEVHPDHLSRCFRQRYGMLIGEYVRRLRVDWAANKIVTTDMPLVQIALGAGFSDQSEFTRRFREQMGTTPSRYRATRVSS